MTKLEEKVFKKISDLCKRKALNKISHMQRPSYWEVSNLFWEEEPPILSGVIRSLIDSGHLETNLGEGHVFDCKIWLPESK